MEGPSRVQDDPKHQAFYLMRAQTSTFLVSLLIKVIYKHNFKNTTMLIVKTAVLCRGLFLTLVMISPGVYFLILKYKFTGIS